MDDAVRRRLNDERDMLFFVDLYNRWYGVDGNLKPPDKNSTRQKDIYAMMGLGGVGYLEDAITLQDFRQFVNGAKGNYSVRQQSTEKYPQWRDALTAGDYFYVDNRKYLPKWDDLAWVEGIKKRTRRLIVNVRSQDAGLRAAGALTRLLSDPVVGPHFYQFKVFLSTTSQPERDIKNDKLVVYYIVGPDSADGADVVGDQLVAAITSVLEADDADPATSPFYSTVTTPISWAEEAEDYLTGYTGKSFTQTRSMIIADVINNTPRVGDAAELAYRILLAFEDKGVSAPSRHRHTGRTGPTGPTGITGLGETTGTLTIPTTGSFGTTTSDPTDTLTTTTTTTPPPRTTTTTTTPPPTTTTTTTSSSPTTTTTTTTTPQSGTDVAPTPTPTTSEVLTESGV
ncbi:T3SS effector HopA1 family protein [Acrocarpospora macrocephala]|uniref:T3SS effector HopA1 family protein n=1 Tax=Acrocarpospora macrocephala TaxID=150177 RepID=UPI0012D2C9F8|nr:T3SS effector HopA1 family protein [Acrocarpospora macrocephala]